MKHRRRRTDTPDLTNYGHNPHVPGGIPHTAWQAGYDGIAADCRKGSLYESWYRQGAAAAAYDQPSWAMRLASWIWSKFIQPTEKKQ